MLENFIQWSTRHRGITLFLQALLSRIFFAAVIIGTALLATRFSPQQEYIYRRSTIFRGPTEDVIDLEWRDDSQWLAAASKDGNIFLWDFTKDYEPDAHGRARIILPLQEGEARDIAFTHNNHWLISAGTDKKVKFWDVSSLSNTSIDEYKAFVEQVEQDETFIRYYPIDIHKADVQLLALSLDGHWLASADISGGIYLYDLRSDDFNTIQASARKLDGHSLSLTGLVFSPSSHLLAASDISGNISVWDLTLLPDAPDQFNSSVIRFDHPGRVNDIAFDLAFEAASRQPERYLFSAGADENVYAWSLRGEQHTRLTKTHDAPVTQVALTRDEALNEYWLVSADQKGQLVFWDLYRWDSFETGTLNSEFFYVDAGKQPVSSLNTNLTRDPLAAVGDKWRHLLLGITENTVQVFPFGAPRGQWIPITLSPASGKINAIAIDLFNHHIATAGRDNTVRIWDTSYVTDASLAFPTRQFLRFLTPILLGLVLAVHSASAFLMRTYNIVKRSNAIKYILNAVFGFQFKNVGLFLLSLLVPIWQELVIDNGQTINGEGIHMYDIIGGPAKVVIRPGNVVAFQTIRARTAVHTNYTYYLFPFERIRKVISLEDQYKQYDNIITYTRDGIEVTLQNVRIRYRVKFQKHIENEKESIRARYQNLPDPVDPASLDLALEMLNWTEAVERSIRTKIIHFVNIRPLDYFTSPLNHEKDEKVRDEFRRHVIETTQPILNSFGADLVWIDVGTFEISPQIVKDARQKLWMAKARKEAELQRAQGRAELETYREMGRLKAESEIINAIINEMRKWEADAQLQGEGEPTEDEQLAAENMLKRTAFLNRLAEILRAYLRTAISENTMFTTQLPKDTNKK